MPQIVPSNTTLSLPVCCKNQLLPNRVSDRFTIAFSDRAMTEDPDVYQHMSSFESYIRKILSSWTTPEALFVVDRDLAYEFLSTNMPAVYVANLHGTNN